MKLSNFKVYSSIQDIKELEFDITFRKMEFT